MAVQISQEQSYAYAELLEILSFTDANLVSKIPYKLMHIFQKYASTSYEKHLDMNLPLENQDISKKTATLITLLTLNYWCDSEDEKNEIKLLLNENAKIKEQQLREKYNPDNIFKNNNTHQPSHISESLETNNEEYSDLPMDYNQLPWYQKLYFSFKTYLLKLFKK